MERDIDTEFLTVSTAAGTRQKGLDNFQRVIQKRHTTSRFQQLPFTTQHYLIEEMYYYTHQGIL